MFFVNQDDRHFHIIQPEYFAIHSELEVGFGGLRTIPTHTEDGIPIRKLYVSNLPPNTTRTELFEVFAQYGFIKSCWLRMGERGPARVLTPTYAFVTFNNPADAHSALTAPEHDKILRGRMLRISPADSWHQPAVDAQGRVHWKIRKHNNQEDATGTDTHDNVAASTSQSFPAGDVIQDQQKQSDQVVPNPDEEPTYSILDILNQDCLHHILSYVPIRDLFRVERVSKQWQNMTNEYFLSIRTFKTSWWQHGSVMLTTAVLRRLLQRLGPSLLRLHIDYHWSALNDRTAHIVGKWCPNLEELKVFAMNTKNWNPLTYGCNQLKNISFISCNRLTDSSLVHLVKHESCVESLTVANNNNITGLFLSGANPSNLTHLSFFNCPNLQGPMLSAAIDTLPNISSLQLDVGTISLWKIIPPLLRKLPNLLELSLKDYTATDIYTNYPSDTGTALLCESFEALTQLRVLNLSRNVHISNVVLKQVAQSCRNLKWLDVSSCNSKKTLLHRGVSDEGIIAICRACTDLQHLNISYLSELSDAGAASAALSLRLRTLISRANTVTATPFEQCVRACHSLQEVDVCGCEAVTESLVTAACAALEQHPRVLALYMAGTSAASQDAMLLEEYPCHKLLSLNVRDDRSNPHLMPDFIEHSLDDSEESYDELFDDPDDFDIYLGSDDDDFLDEDLVNDYENGILAMEWGFNADNIILL